MKDFLNGAYGLSELNPEERLDALYEFLSALPEKTSRKKIYEMFPGMSKYQIDNALRVLDFSNILTVWRGVVEKTDLARRIEAKGKLELSDFYMAPSWVLRKLKRKPVRTEVYVGEDTSTGYDIYYDYLRKNYVLRDSSGRVVKKVEDVGMILTFSLETNGHERLACEMASWTWVKEMHPKRMNEVVDKLAKFMQSVLKTYFGFKVEDVAIKGGLEYMTEAGSYISEEAMFEAEFSVDKIYWENARCEIEYVHERKYVENGVIKYSPVRKSKISITLEEFEKKHPEVIGSEREVQGTLSFKVRKK